MLKDKLIKLNAYTKNKLGLCCSKGCFHKAAVNVTIPCINVERSLCEKHLLEFQKLELQGCIQRKTNTKNSEVTMNKKYLLLCNRHTSMYGSNWCLWWGNRESTNGYTSDLRLAHRFTWDEVKQYEEDSINGDDIIIPIDVLGISEGYEPEETYNENIRVLIEKSTLNKLMNLQLRVKTHTTRQDYI